MYRFETVFEFSVPRIKFGWNAISEIGYEVRHLRCKRALMVSDKGLVKTGIPDSVKAILDGDDSFEIFIYSDASPEPSMDDFERCISFAKEEDIDLLVAVGGGAVSMSLRPPE